MDACERDQLGTLATLGNEYGKNLPFYSNEDCRRRGKWV